MSVDDNDQQAGYMDLDGFSILGLYENLELTKRSNGEDVVAELKEAERQGHTYLHLEDLQARIYNDTDARFIVEDDRVYLKYLYYSEVGVANKVKKLLLAPAARIDMPIRPTEGEFVPNDKQWEAITNVLTHRISVIQGLPGTGKTTLIKMLLDIIDSHPLFEHDWKRYTLAAPTGKAARRLSEATGRDASTIHRLLGYHPSSGYTHTEGHPLLAKFIIIDESSMLDITLVNALLRAVSLGSHIVFIGDAKQLPPVRAGRVFEDLLATDGLAKVSLTEIFRQARSSLIVRNAHRIIHGERPFASAAEARDVLGVQSDEVRDDFFFSEATSGNIPAQVADLIVNRIPKAYDIDAEDIMVVAPMTKGIAGLENLNIELRKHINPNGLPIGVEGFHIGDRIIQTKNDYEINVMNGELAIIEEFDFDEETALLNFGSRKSRVAAKKLKTFLPGFAISVHRAQGSQAPVVITIADKYHSRMLNPTLINTAITRAQLLCIVVGQWEAIEAAVRDYKDIHRNSYLPTRITNSSTSQRGTS